MNTKIVLNDRDLENADIIGSKRFHENKKHQRTMSWNLKKMTTPDRDILGAQGEIAFEKWCLEHDLHYTADYLNTQIRSSAQDSGDGTLFLNRRPFSIEIKTTTAKDPHLIIPEYQMKNPKDIYILLKKTSSSSFKLMGFITPEMLEDFYDDSCLHTVNTCYRAHWSHLIGDLQQLSTLGDT